MSAYDTALHVATGALGGLATLWAVLVLYSLRDIARELRGLVNAIYAASERCK